MYARTSTWTGTPEALDSWVRHVTTRLVRWSPGCLTTAAHTSLSTETKGRALTLTLWKSEGAALRSDETADKSRESTVAATGVELLERGRFEVVGKV